MRTQSKHCSVPRMFCTIGLLVGLFCIQTPLAHAGLALRERLDTVTQIIDLFIHHYAPLRWKEEFLGISFEQLVDTLTHDATVANSDEEFYDAVVRFIAGLRDAHLGVTIPSTYTAALGVTVDAFGNELVIVDIDRGTLPVEIFPFEIGDRVVRFDGQDVHAALQRLIPYVETGNPQANRRLAARELTARSQTASPFIPQGSAELVIYSRRARKEQRVAIPWRHEGYPLASLTERPLTAVRALAAMLPSLSHSSGVLLPDPLGFLETGKMARWDERTEFRRLMGDVRPFFPMWREFVQRSTTPYFSGIIAVDGYRIGFLRLHSWSNKHHINQKEVIPFLEKEIPYLEEHTDALIIDQSSAAGGSGCLVEAVAGFFVRSAGPTVRDAIKPTRSMLTKFEEAEASDVVSPEEQKILRQMIAAIRGALQRGDDLTEPLPICAVDGQLHPHYTAEGKRTIYTKPKLLLINELSCSASDMFPAVVQDVGVVTTFGSGTMGCGGAVGDFENIGHAELDNRVTLTLMVRAREVTTPNGTRTRYLENVGVLPDIPYTVTVKDFDDDYAAYRAAILQAVIQLIVRWKEDIVCGDGALNGCWHPLRGRDADR